MGKGSINFNAVSNRYLIDLAVTADYDAVALGHDLRWRSSFEFASLLLFNATKGQMQLGKLIFVNNRASTSDDDIVVVNLTGSSMTTDQSTPFNGQIFLYLHVMNEPICAVHEFGHYVATLGDEYFGTLRVCQNNPATHQCIMEFSRNYGLKLDNSGHVAKLQPFHVVEQFCFHDHPHVPFPWPTNNEQENKHRQPCWETLKRIYPKLNLPTQAHMVNTIQPIQWIAASPISKYAIAFEGNTAFNLPTVEKAVKIAVKEWVNRIAYTGDQLAMVMGSQGVIRPMHAILPAEIPKLHKLIDAAVPGERMRKAISDATDQFQGDIAAYQRLLLVEAGNSNEDASSLPVTLEEKRVTLVAMTVGRGKFADQLDELERSSKWVTQENFPIEKVDLTKYAFSFQNELIESFFYNAPGYGIVDLRWGNLPASAAPVKTPGKDPVADPEEGLDVFLQLGAEGFDFPVWIEQNAISLSFLLSEPVASHIELSLIPPNEEIAYSVPARTGLPIHAFDRKENISGRWIVRLRRKTNGPELPFFFLAAVNNRALRTSTHIEVTPNRNVQFQLQVIHTFPIDYVDGQVDILRLAPDESNDGETYRSVPLRRERVLDPSNQKMTEVSSGFYGSEIQLEPGSYTAIFRAYNHGRAIYASNPSGVVGGNIATYQQKQIPPFARVIRERFQVK